MGREGHERRFQKKLQGIVRNYIILVALVSTALFVVGQFVVVVISHQTNAVRHLDQLEESLLFFDGQSRNFLDSQDTLDAARQIITAQNQKAVERLENIFWKFGERCGISSEILIVDRQGAIQYTSFSERQLSSYLVNYNNAICYNAKNTGTDDTYRAVYYDQGDYANVLYVKPVTHRDTVVGYVSVFLSGSSWNFYLSESNFDGVITDLRDNAMYVSKPGLLRAGNKFSGTGSSVWHGETGRYWVASRYLPQQSAVIYSLVYYPPNDGLWVGILILLAISVAWYWIAMWISRTMAAKNAASVETLVEEIHLVRKDPGHRIQLHTADEFEDVGSQINELLEHIMYLNRLNEELIALNARIEFQQLTEQINPHFLYNTLETIRNLVIFDAPKAEELILDLTDILRYSVDNSRHEVLLAEDMEYLRQYLNIQSCRFGERLHWHSELSPECGRFHVPKLLIQPIVENSIKYGFRKKMQLNISITGCVENGVLHICVSDDGGGMEPAEAQILEEQLASSHHHSRSIGLHNLSRRLCLGYGDQSGLRIKNSPNEGFQVYISVQQRKEA